MENNILKVNKRKFHFLVKKDHNEVFWTQHYHNWEEKSFDVYDTYLKPGGVMIDIGAWNGCTSLYSMNLCQHIIAVEADKLSVQNLRQNVELNDASQRITIVDKAIYPQSHALVKFGKNLHLSASKLDDSTSQIHQEPQSSDYYLVETIAPSDLILNYVQTPENLCLIKVDIEGGEEMMLHELWAIKRQYNCIFHFI